LKQLYLNRIATYKNITPAKMTKVNQFLKANFGIFEETFWPNFKTVNIINY
jgi:hypothetical protein